MIHIFRGDSANETFGNQITVALETDMDTTDCKCRLTMPYAEKTSFIVDGRAVFTFTTEETAQIPFGEYYASLSLLNGSAKLTIRDDLIVSVTDSVAEASRDNTISVDVVGRFTEALKGVVWNEGSTIKTLREFLSRVGEAMGATVVRLALVSMIPLFAFSQGTIDSDMLVPGTQVVTNAFQNASNDIARLIASSSNPTDTITDGTNTLHASLDYDRNITIPDTWSLEGNTLYPEGENSWSNSVCYLEYYMDAWFFFHEDHEDEGSDRQEYPQDATELYFNIAGDIYHLTKIPAHQSYSPLGKVALKSDVSSEIASATNSIPKGLTTNDVCEIVTNEVSSATWTLPDVFNGAELAPSMGWIEENGDKSKFYYFFGYIRYEDGEWVGDYQERFWDGDLWDGDGWNVYGQGGEDATSVTFTVEGFPPGQDTITATREGRNALGLARIKDLPQNTPVNEILFNGADGKVYHLRIGAGGSIDIYTEVSP